MNTQQDFINEICAEENIAVESLSKGYILRLAKNGITCNIAGPYWDINSAASDRIACDKYGCYIVLNQNGIPAIEHELIFNPLRRGDWAGTEGVWTKVLAYFNAHNQKIVVKSNQGWGGHDVHYCETPAALEQAVHEIFAKYPDAALSPYHEIKTEYRVFYFQGQTPLAYGKTKGEDWKHNLAHGAKAFELADEKLLASLKSLAARAASCIGITFATIDIAELETGELSVMEINAGVQARFLADQHPHLRSTIKNIYTQAILHMLKKG